MVESVAQWFKFALRYKIGTECDFKISRNGVQKCVRSLPPFNIKVPLVGYFTMKQGALTLHIVGWEERMPSTMV